MVIHPHTVIMGAGIHSRSELSVERKEECSQLSAPRVEQSVFTAPNRFGSLKELVQNLATPSAQLFSKHAGSTLVSGQIVFKCPINPKSELQPILGSSNSSSNHHFYTCLSMFSQWDPNLPRMCHVQPPCHASCMCHGDGDPGWSPFGSPVRNQSPVVAWQCGFSVKFSTFEPMNPMNGYEENPILDPTTWVVWSWLNRNQC
jgi:hypothetical protein